MLPEQTQTNLIDACPGHPRSHTTVQKEVDIFGANAMQTSEGATMPVSVWTSTLNRTIQTAEGLPFPKLRWKVLDEIQAGIFDGWTYKEIEEKKPQEFAARKSDKLRYRHAHSCMHACCCCISSCARPQCQSDAAVRRTHAVAASHPA